MFPVTQPRTLRNFVDGQYVDAAGESTSELINPSTGQVVATAPISSQEDVDAAYASAAKAFEGEWGESTPSERQSALLKFADALEARADDLIRLEGENTGKPHALTATEEVPVMCDQLRFFAGAARVLEGRASAEYMKGHTSWIRREPIGVVGQVTPWNYPMMMAAWKIGPALAAGNSIVLKPSDTTPETTLLMAEVASEFLPAGTFNVITGDRDTGRMVVEHKTPQLVAITGSVRAGMQVAESASKDLKRVHLELGGKAPALVCPDYPLEQAAARIAWRGSARIRRRHGGAEAQQGRIGLAEERDVSDRQRAHRLAVVAAGQADEAALARAAGVAPVVGAHLQRDLGGGGAVAAVEGVAQAGERAQALGQLHHRRVGEAGEHHVLEAVQLLADPRVDPRIGVAEHVDPPGTDRVEVALAFEVFEPDAFAALDRDQRQLFVVFHLGAGVPDHGAGTRNEVGRTGAGSGKGGGCGGHGIHGAMIALRLSRFRRAWRLGTSCDCCGLSRRRCRA